MIADLFWDFFWNYSSIIIVMMFAKKNDDIFKTMKWAFVYTVVIMILYNSLMYFVDSNKINNQNTEKINKELLEKINILNSN